MRRKTVGHSERPLVHRTLTIDVFLHKMSTFTPDSSTVLSFQGSKTHLRFKKYPSYAPISSIRLLLPII